MAQCCYKIHRKDPQTYPKIEAVSSSQLLRGNTKGISSQYLNATQEAALYSQNGAILLRITLCVSNDCFHII